MIVHLDVLGPGVENRVLRELDADEVVAVDRRRDSRSSVFCLGARQCNCRLLLTAPRDRDTPKRERISGRRSTIGGVD